MFEDKLLQVGLNKGEARVYVELLKIGPQAVSVISKKVDIYRTTVYSILIELQRKGLVSSFKKRSGRFFVANDPNTLVGYLDKRCQTLDYYKTQLLDIIPSLRSLAGHYELKRPIVAYFEGVGGVEHVMYDSLSTAGSFYAIMAPNKWQQSRVREFFTDCKDFRIQHNRLPSRIIAPDTNEVRQFFNQYLKEVGGTVGIVFLDANCGLFESEVNIYESKVNILSLKRTDEYGVVIESDEIAIIWKALFEFAWAGGRQYSRKHEDIV